MVGLYVPLETPFKALRQSKMARLYSYKKYILHSIVEGRMKDKASMAALTKVTEAPLETRPNTAAFS